MSSSTDAVWLASVNEGRITVHVWRYIDGAPWAGRLLLTFHDGAHKTGRIVTEKNPSLSYIEGRVAQGLAELKSRH